MAKVNWRDYRNNLPMVPMFFMSPFYMKKLMIDEGFNYSPLIFEILLSFFEEASMPNMYELVEHFYKKYHPEFLTYEDIIKGNTENDPYKLLVEELF